jgi:hypothetical protein
MANPSSQMQLIMGRGRRVASKARHTRLDRLCVGVWENGSSGLFEVLVSASE